MNISWLSTRKIDTDLCSTTQVELANGLVAKGHVVNFYSPGFASGVAFNHHNIKRSKIMGLQTYSICSKLKSLVDEISQSDIVLIDWQLFSIHTKLATKTIIIDRGPPADRGLLAKLQWPQWKRNWKKAKKGTVVSLEHKKFLVNKCKISSDNIHVIPAGVNLDLFSKSEKKGKLKLLYHGNLDLNRNILELPQILIHLEKAGVDVEMHLIGHGDAFKALSKLNLPNLKLSGPINQRELASMISEFDIGFLPMPNSGVWNIASPLKRSEYSGSGMVIIGIDHAGHRFSEDLDWVFLFEESKFVSEAVNFCKNIKRKELSILQNKSRTYAERYLSWHQSVDTLNRLIHSVVD
ncbi:MAG: hypothetical protein CMF94_01105 [Candidatus Marinimicrobia bacterium]|nr:hypothetical protein [Candidatus Neomarinimicrobiota bacterium]|tara:strand:- start:494 stop:1546 length:1053 start_codon:yes stop_codon:yes gene_type:complete